MTNTHNKITINDTINDNPYDFTYVDKKESNKENTKTKNTIVVNKLRLDLLKKKIKKTSNVTNTNSLNSLNYNTILSNFTIHSPHEIIHSDIDYFLFPYTSEIPFSNGIFSDKYICAIRSAYINYKNENTKEFYVLVSYTNKNDKNSYSNSDKNGIFMEFLNNNILISNNKNSMNLLKEFNIEYIVMDNLYIKLTDNIAIIIDMLLNINQSRTNINIPLILSKHMYHYGAYAPYGVEYKKSVRSKTGRIYVYKSKNYVYTKDIKEYKDFVKHN